MVGITGGTIAHHFRINLCTAGLCMFVFLQNHRTCTFPHDKTAAAFVKRQRCRIRVFGRIQRHTSPETCYRQRHDGRFAAAADGRCGIAVENGSVAFPNGRCTCGTGSGNRHAGIHGLITDGNIPCRDIVDHFRDGQRGNSSFALRHQGILAFCKGLKTADPAAEINRQFFLFNIAFQRTVCHGFPCSTQRKLGEAVNLFCRHFIHICCRIEVLHFRRQFIFAFAGVVSCDRADAVFSVFQCFPEIGYVVAHRGHRTDTCYNYSSHLFTS